MSQQQPQRRIEQWAGFFQKADGLINILIGLVAIGAGLVVASDKIIYWLIFYILGIGIWRASDRWMIYPSKTCIQPSDKRNYNKATLIGILFALLLLLVVLIYILLNLARLAS